MKMLPTWWDDIKYFKPSEFDVKGKKGSGAQNMDEYTVRMLDDLRDMLGRPLTVSTNGGYRDYGSETSQHRFGRAVDIKVSSGVERAEIVRAAIALGFKGIGVYDKHIHVDTREQKLAVMWSGKSK